MKLQNILKEKNEGFYNHFKGNIEKVKVLLEKATPIEYTFHGFDHATQLEIYAEQLMSDEIINALSEDEIFILLHGIYYHDIGMINYSRESVINHIRSKDEGLANQIAKFLEENPEIKENTEFLKVNREEHNLLSARMIYPSEYVYDSRIISLPNEKYAKSISLLCLGHRDYKVNKRIIKTLDEIPSQEPYPKGEVHTRFLACIVRLADELDVTHQRASSDILTHISHFLTKRSYDEWVNHDLISMVKIDNKYHRIILFPNKDYIVKRDKEIGGDRQIIRNAIFSKLEKLQIEIDNIIPYIYQNAVEPYKLGYSKVEIDFDDTVCIENDLENYQKTKEKAEQTLMLENQFDPTEAVDNDSVNHKFEKRDLVVDENGLEKKIKEFKELVELLYRNDNLLSLGNFILPSGYYTRYYFNTNHILPQSKFLNLITSIFQEKYDSLGIDCVVGIDKAGQILAPNLSLNLKCNYTYLVHNNEIDFSVSFEKGCSIQSANSILLVTDVISSGNTIEQAIIKLQAKFKPQKIFVAAVFCSNKLFIESSDSIKDAELFYLIGKFKFECYSPEQLKIDENLRNEFNILKSIKK